LGILAYGGWERLFQRKARETLRGGGLHALTKVEVVDAEDAACGFVYKLAEGFPAYENSQIGLKKERPDYPHCGIQYSLIKP